MFKVYLKERKVYKILYLFSSQKKQRYIYFISEIECKIDNRHNLRTKINSSEKFCQKERVIRRFKNVGYKKCIEIYSEDTKSVPSIIP